MASMMEFIDVAFEFSAAGWPVQSAIRDAAAGEPLAPHATTTLTGADERVLKRLEAMGIEDAREARERIEAELVRRTMGGPASSS